MRILIASHNYPRFAGDPAGAFVAQLAAAAVRAGHDVTVVSPHAPAAPEGTMEDNGVLLRRFRYGPDALERVAYSGDVGVAGLWNPRRLVALPMFLSRFRRALGHAERELQPDVIHAHWWFPAAALSYPLRTPYVVTSHGSDVRIGERLWPIRPLVRSVYRKAAKVTAVSRFLCGRVARLARLPAEAVEVTYMPVDEEWFGSDLAISAPPTPQVLYAGNLIRSKGLDVLLRAFARLRTRGVAARLKLLGEGRDESRLRALAGELGIAGDVEWSRFVPQSEMQRVYQGSTVSVLPTRGSAEGLGLTLVEALLCGCAVVGSEVGGIPEVVEHGITGLLFPDGDHMALSDRLETMLTRTEMRMALTRTGRERMEQRHRPDAAFAVFDQVYRTAIERHD